MAKSTKYKHKNEEKGSFLFTGERVKDNTKLDTQDGEIIVTAGNYIFTDSNGIKFGVAESELGVTYIEAKDSTSKK